MRHIDALSAVRVHSFAEVLAAANGDMSLLRPFLGKDGRSYVVVNGQKLAINAPAAHSGGCLARDRPFGDRGLYRAHPGSC